MKIEMHGDGHFRREDGALWVENENANPRRAVRQNGTWRIFYQGAMVDIEKMDADRLLEWWTSPN